MKNFLTSSFAILTIFVSINCSGGSDDDNDDNSAANCVTCEVIADGLDFEVTREWCDNGDGTYDLTVTSSGQSSTDTFPFTANQTLDDLIDFEEDVNGSICDN